MLIKRISQLTGTCRSVNINITKEQYNKWVSGMTIQVAMPNITADEREFIMSGITREEWDLYFPEEEEA